MIFISYSHLNNSVAGEVKAELEAAHYSCFLAHDDIAAGKDWHDEIWKALRDCDAFVGLVTQEFNASAWCQQEVGAALALNKPRLLVRVAAPNPPGFAGRFQGAKRTQVVSSIDTLPSFEAARIEAWISAVASVQNYSDANALHERFHDLWQEMSEEKKLRWILAGAGNNQVAGAFRQPRSKLLREPIQSGYEARDAAPFFRQAFAEMKKLMTDQWLFDNDKRGVLHDPDENPVSKPQTPRSSRR